ncbi:MAG: hypothetical protein QNJ85_18400 [Gammaproteobacteria bacterium]|nr:hypothetical protein [Gammaproteobacteria bacterium]
MDTTSNNNAGWLALLKPATGRAQPDLDDVIARIRGRWRLRLLLDGSFWALVFASGAFLLAAWLVDWFHFAPPAVWLARAALLLTLLVLTLGFCLRPLRREADDVQVALYLEEHEPELASIVLSAVDAGRQQDAALSSQMIEQLRARALEACARIEYGDRVEREGHRRAFAKLGVAALLLIALALAPPAFLERGAPALLQAWASVERVSPYRIELAPGDAEIARGADQLISATIDGFDGDGVVLLTSTDGGLSWQQATMDAIDDAGRYQAFLFDVGADTDYYVAGAGRETPVYRLTVTDIPAVETIGLRYHFPSYTMLPPETLLDTGDIAALRGTRVEVLVEPSIPIPGGVLELDDGEQIALTRAADGRWQGELRVERDGAYRVLLQRASGTLVATVPEYGIAAIDDQHPSVSILSPGRDTRVSMIEEPVLRVSAADDQGVARLELVLSVNGEAEQRIALLASDVEPASLRSVEAEHVVYLEDLGLEPGDLISYYVSADELAPADATRTATSDMFFYQVRPFSNNFRRAEGGDGGGAGGGGQQGGESQGQLAEQQKQFVVATFKMIRDRDSFSDETWRENLDLLVTAQARIRDRVEAIIRRIESRAVIRTDPRYRAILEELPQATGAMREVERELGEAEVDAALTDAQVALKHLQRADAVFRDINVSLSNQGQGSGDSQGFEDLMNLFELEMDKLRHQYDTVQHGGERQPPAEEVIDETLEKLRELARRQQQEIERQLRRQGQPSSASASRRQQALAEELEEMARQLERLTRQQPNPQLEQSVRQMREAAEAMRQAAENSGGSGNNVDQARQAAEQLREAQRLLDQGRVRQFSEAVERSLRRAELAERRQAEIARDTAGFDTERDAGFEDRLDRLQQKKQTLSDDLNELEQEIGELLTEAKEDQPRAGQALREALRAGRDARLQDRIGRTRKMLRHDNRELAEDNENEIRQGIARIREQIARALDSVDADGARGQERAVEQLRDLARDLRSIRDRGAADSRGQRGATGGFGPSDGESRGGPILRPGELSEIAERARAVGRGLVEEGIPPGDVEPVLQSLEALAGGSGNADPAAQDLALQALMELEYRLRNQLVTKDSSELPLSDPTEIPDEYRDMIADYYRSLSEQ